MLERYNAAGFKVGIIHSNREDSENLCVINEVKAGKLDGLISVGMASEGLDIPLLKIAILHRTPKSIPYTIQFLGRISRQPKEQVGNALLIANVDEVRERFIVYIIPMKHGQSLFLNLLMKKTRKARFYRTAIIDEEDLYYPI